MRPKQERDRERLLDIVEAADSIARYVVYGEQRFHEDELVQTWMLHHLQIIGEAVAALTQDVRQRVPDIPWTKIVGMRNIIVHQYSAVDPNVVWRAAFRDAPELRAVAWELAQQMPEEE